MNATVETELDGISYSIIETGSESGDILIFLPGFGASKDNYRVHLGSFRAFYSRIVAIDLPEQGSKGLWRIGAMVDNLTEFIDSLDDDAVKCIDLAGHSTGALAILAYVCNYNSAVENELLFAVNRSSAETRHFEVSACLTNTRFGRMTPSMMKVRNLFLYAPPDKFGVTFPEKACRWLSSLSERTLYRLLNVFINRPMQLLGLLQADSSRRLKINRSKKPQFFRLIVQDYRSFLEYIACSLSMFEIAMLANESIKNKISVIFETRNVLIQYGSLDWVIKPFFGRTAALERAFRISNETNIIRHQGLGHLLNKRLHPDIDLNVQMLTNHDIISRSIGQLRNR